MADRESRENKIAELLAGVKPPQAPDQMPWQGWGSEALAKQQPNWFGQNVLGAVGKVAEAMPPGSFDIAAGLLPGAKLPRVPNPIKAYHGSPHDFDAFDAAHIGKGEGAQAYGHGLYFAEAEGVARNYRDQLSQSTYGGKPYAPDAEVHAGMALEVHGGDRAAARQDLQQVIDFEKRSPTAGREDRVRLAEESLRAFDDGRIKEAGSTGRMYEVALHAEPQQFLDSDLPLRKQPAAAQQVIRELAKDNVLLGSRPPANVSTGDILQRLAIDKTSDPAALAAKLREAGIPGIRYKDQLSRGTAADLQQELATWERGLASAQARKDPGDIAKFSERVQEARDRLSGKIGGTSNYVVFPGSEHIIEILKKYGIAGLLAAGAAMPDQGENH